MPEKKTRTPRNVESISKGALALPFNEQVELFRKLEANISSELKRLQEQVDEVAKLIAGK